MINRSVTVSADTVPSEQDLSRVVDKKNKLSEARRRMPLNMLSNMTWLGVNMVVGLWYTPYLIAHLGVAVYGLVPLAISVTSYLGLLTDGFNSAVSRFLQIELARDDNEAANRIFNTSVTGALTILGLIIPIALVISTLAPRIFNVPLGHEQDAQWLVLFTMLAFGTTFLSSSFAISSFSSHRFDLRLGLNIIRISAQMGIIVVLFTVLSPRLWQVGLGIFLSALLYLLGHRQLCTRLTPHLKIKLHLFDLSRLKQMLKFSGWVLINQAGSQLFINIDLLVANLVFGAIVSGRYGAVLIFSSLLRAMVGTISAVLDPIVFTLYAQNNLNGLARFCSITVKFVGLVIALPIGLICGLARPLLTVWLGSNYSDLSWLVMVLVGHLCINLAVIPLFPIQVSTNHVRVPGILTLIMGLANAGLAVALAKWSGWGYISIAIAGALVLTAKNSLFTPLYAAHLLKLPWHTFATRLINGVLGFVVVAAGSYLISLNLSLASWSSLALVGISISGIYILGAYFFGLRAEERLLIKTEIRQRMSGQ